MTTTNLWTQVTEFLSVLKPTGGDKFLMTLGGTIGAAFSFAVGGVDDAMLWLLIMAGIDYVTGTIASFREQQWCSDSGFKGLFKKAFMFAVVALCHGIDVTTGQDLLRDVAVFAYAVNEAGSILENVERLGFGRWIPPFIKAGLKALREKENELLKGENKNDNKGMH